MPCDMQLVHQYIDVIRQQGGESGEAGSDDNGEGSSLRRDSGEKEDSSLEDSDEPSDSEETDSDEEEMRRKRRKTR